MANNEKLNMRYCARVLVEAVTPLKIGTGETGLNIDELVATDANGLPVIPGTALAGVLRHAIPDAGVVKDLFGFQDKKEGQGSRLIFSSARFVGKNGDVMDGLQTIDFTDPFYEQFRKMAMRDHVRIEHNGVAADKAKFDSQVVFKGTRFVFDMELKGSEEDSDNWENLLRLIQSPLFRLGGGTRKGFGELKVVALEQEKFDLQTDSDGYLHRSSRLTVPNGRASASSSNSDERYIRYYVSLKPEDFFIFSAGYGDKDTDDIAKKERVLRWANGRPAFSEEKVLIPATSVKGAIAHRVAFHYNRLNKIYADQLSVEEFEQYTGENNKAVSALFGYAKNSDKGANHGQRGRVILSDTYKSDVKEKVFNHVSIDRFTGGAMDGALYNEKVSYRSDNINLDIYVEPEAFDGQTEIEEALDCALKDLAMGLLPLGGHTMRGHGCFTGHIMKIKEGVESELV